jgi:hypothetical protein
MNLSGGKTDAPKWLGAPIEEVAAASPLVAYCRVKRIPLQPYLLNIRATFNDTVTTVGPVSWSITGGNAAGGIVEYTRLSQFAIMDRMMYHLSQPNANAGAQLKPLSDFFFRTQSDIAATMVVDGAPRFSVTADYTPIDTLMAMFNEQWAYGWVLGYTQVVKMQFLPSTLLVPPTNLVCTFRLWQATQDAEALTGKTESWAIDQLTQMGINCGFEKGGSCRS